MSIALRTRERRRLTLGASAVEVAEAQRPLLALLVAAIRAGFEQSALQRLPHMVLLREDFYDEPHGDDGALMIHSLRPGHRTGTAGAALEPSRAPLPSPQAARSSSCWALGCSASSARTSSSRRRPPAAAP